MYAQYIVDDDATTNRKTTRKVKSYSELLTYIETNKQLFRDKILTSEETKSLSSQLLAIISAAGARVTHEPISLAAVLVAVLAVDRTL